VLERLSLDDKLVLGSEECLAVVEYDSEERTDAYRFETSLAYRDLLAVPGEPVDLEPATRDLGDREGASQRVNE
jgi:hypothetical protein